MAGADVAVVAVVAASRVGEAGTLPTGGPQVANPNIASAAKTTETRLFIIKDTFGGAQLR